MIRKKQYIYSFLVLFFTALTSVPIAADYVDQSAAPLSSKFIQWQRLHYDNLQNNYDIFSDTAQTELSTGYRPSPVDNDHLIQSLPKRKILRNKAGQMPSRYDLRDYGRVTDVKNQAPYGTCWAFGAMSAIESNYISQNLSFIEGTPDLSELHLAWFAYKDPIAGNSYVIAPSGALGSDKILDQGGNYTMSIAYLSRMSGPVKEDNLKYENASNMNNLSQDPKSYFPIENRAQVINLIKENIVENGGISANYYAGTGATSPNSSVVAYFDNTHDDEIDHNVTIIGWDDNFDRTNFATYPEKNGAWIVKNSWGKNWGNNGYFYMSYEQYIEDIVSYSVKENTDGIKHYGHDALGYINHFSRVWAANVFKTESWNEGIKEVGLYTTSYNTSFDIYIFNLGTETPEKPTPNEIDEPLYIEKGVEIMYPGYHNIELDKLIPLSKDHYFSVIVRMRSNYSYPTSVETYSENFSEPVINTGETWFAKGSSEILTSDMVWDDGANGVTFSNNTLPTPMNACIKAFTVPLIPEGIEINAENFPDVNFMSYVIENFDTNGNNYLSASEISNAKNISVNGHNITYLKGIEFLTELVSLDCSKNNISSMELKYNSNLQALYCSENNLKALDLSKNLKITADNLRCENQNISDNAKLSETFSDDDYKYKFDLSKAFSSDIYEKISDIKAVNIETKFDAETHTAFFKAIPGNIVYYYDTSVDNALMAVNMLVSSNLVPVKPIIKTSERLLDGTIGENYTYELVAKGTGTIFWSKTSGDLPRDFTLSESGIISGIPEKTGIFRFEATAKNDTGTTSADFSIRILNQAPAISVNAVSQSITAGEGNFNITFTASKGTNLKWTSLGLLPSGVETEISEMNFKIFGTPALSEAGKVFTYTVTASNDVNFDKQTIKLNVKNAAPVLNEVATSYELETTKNIQIILTAIKGTNIDWITSGNLPAGLIGKKYSSNSFRIEGTPAATAMGKEFDYTVTASNDIEAVNKKFLFKVSKGEISDIPENQRRSFREYLDTLSDEELAGITTLVIPENVKDLDGLEELLDLPTLDFSKNGLITEVNLDGNDTIENLILSNLSGVKVLNIAKSRVKTVNAKDSNIEEINIEGSEYIEEIDITNTFVTVLNAKNCINLRVIKCSDSEIYSMTLNGCISLKDLECDGNRLSRLDLEEFNLTDFACFGQEVLGWKFSRNMNFGEYLSASIAASDIGSYFEKISNVQGYDAGNHRIPTTFDSQTGKISFPSIPRKITYDYNTGFEDEIMDVTVSGEVSDDNNEDEEEASSSGGGCGIGINFAILVLMSFLEFRKK